MADIVNAEAVRFCNEKARTLADLIEKARRTAEQFAIDVVAFEAIVSGNANGDVVIDGAAEDGRKACTKQKIAELKFVAEQMVTALTTDDREQLVNGLVTNGQPLY